MIGPITGATKIFAGIVAMEISLDNNKIIGRHKMVALTGIDTTSMINLDFISFCNFISRSGESNRIPAVANTDNANPGSIA